MSSLEDLPDELLLDLFENYIRLVDSSVAFARLNHRRLSNILRSSRFSVDIPSKDIFHRPSFLFFAAQIVSLRLSTCCPELDLSTLLRLRFLHMEKPTREQLDSLLAQPLPKLEYLSLCPCWFSVNELPKTLLERCPFVRLPDGRLSSSNK